MPTVLILGANAGIGRALAAEFASHQYDLILAGRDLEELQALAADLNLRHNVNARAETSRCAGLRCPGIGARGVHRSCRRFAWRESFFARATWEIPKRRARI